MLEAIRQSGGTAIAVSDEELLDASLELARRGRDFLRPRRAARAWRRCKKLLADGFLTPGRTRGALQYGRRIEVFGSFFHKISTAHQLPSRINWAG